MDYSFPQVVKLSDVCRVCLMQISNMKYLLNEDDEVFALIAMLESVVNFEFQKNDVLPAYMCVGCENKLRSAYEFQQLCLKSHDTIKTIILSNADGVTDLNESLKEDQLIELQPVDIALEDDTAHTLINISSRIIEDQDNPRETPQEHEFGNHLGNNSQHVEYENVLPKGSELDDYADLQLSENPVPIFNTDNNVNENNSVSVPKQNELAPANDCPVVPVMSSQMPEATARGKTKQTSRLEQFPIEKVNEAIRNVNKKFLENHECLKCNFVGSNARALGLHISYVHKDIKDRWCPQCNLEFDELTAHLKNHTLEEIVCRFCKKSFQAKGHLVEHLRCHSVLRPYPCETCGKGFISARHLKVHMRIHSKTHLYECGACRKNFNNHSGFKRHLKIHHDVTCDVKNCSFYSSSVDGSSMKCPLHMSKVSESGKNNESNPVRLQEAYPNQPENILVANEINREKVPSPPNVLQNFCSICDRNVRSLDCHKRKFHENVHDEVDPDPDKDSNLCIACGKMFKSAARLRAHSRIHTGETPYKCSYCDKKMLTRNHLVVHERTHTGEKPHICKFCGKGFAQSSVLNTHMRLHTGRPVECSICQQRFCRKGELQLHMRKHTGEKPYLCTQCGRAFVQKSHLVDHIKTHTDERPFKCQFCERAFRQNSSLKSHVSIHLGHKPFKCPECPYVCRQSYSLTQHMWIHGGCVGKTKKRHICLVCNRQFSSTTQLTSHNVSIHNMVV